MDDVSFAASLDWPAGMPERAIAVATRVVRTGGKAHCFGEWLAKRAVERGQMLTTNDLVWNSVVELSNISGVDDVALTIAGFRRWLNNTWRWESNS